MSEGLTSHDGPLMGHAPRRIVQTAMAFTLIVVVLHVLRALHAGALWRDEAGAVRLATLPDPRAIPALFQHEAFPLLFPYTVRGFVAVAGASDAALRIFGLLVGLGLLAALWLNARASASAVPIASVALVGLDLPFIIYGDSIRGYGLGCVLILSVYGLLAFLLREPPDAQRRCAMALLPLTAIASVQVLFGNAALLLALGISAATMAALHRRWRLAAWILGSGLVAGLSLLPYVPALAAARHDWSIIVTYPFNARRVFYGFVDALGRRLSILSWLTFVGLGAAGTFIVMRRHDASRSATAGFAALTLLLAPLAQGAFLGALGYRPRDWYYLPLIALMASGLDTLLGIGRPALPRSFGPGVAAALVIALCAQAAPIIQRLTLPASNVDVIARQLGKTVTRGDLVVVTPWYYGVSFERYDRGTDGWLTLPEIADHRVHRYDLLKVKMTSDRPIADLLAAAESHLRSGHHVWVVGDFEQGRRGQVVATIPPAPGSSAGWHEAPYVESWSRQFAAFIADHAGRTTSVVLPGSVEASPLEQLSLVEVEGWRTDQTDPSSSK